MSQQSNFLISASAGTGKTFALASHIIRLLLAGEAPHNITALTFSRAAAAEIFNRVVKRLAEAASSETNAATENTNILSGDCPAGVQKAIAKRFPEGISQQAFLQTLRDFLADQHRSQLGTIDSFLTRIVTLFPSEVGLESSMTMLDKDAQAILRQQVAASVFGSTDDEDYNRLRLILAAETDGESAKTYLGNAAESLKQGRNQLYSHLLPSAWGDPKTIFGTQDPELLALLALDEDTATREFQAALDAFVAKVRDEYLPTPDGFASEYLQFFYGTLSESPHNILCGKTKVDNFIDAPNQLDEKTGTWLIKCKNKSEHIHLSLPMVEQLSSVIRKALCIVLASKLRKIRGRYVMLMNLELAYQRLGPSQGKLDFSDITRLVAQNIASGANPNRSLEYRFDTLIRHLALDEFQDTAPLQWQSLLPIVNELKQADDGRSLFVVGDLKQAIYGWRGGDYRLFKKELESTDYNQRNLVKSYRFRPEISAFVNRIFSADSMNQLASSGVTYNIVDPCLLWGKFWVEHSSEKTSHGYVHVERAPLVSEEDDPEGVEAIARLIYSRLAETQPWKRGLSSAILVRNNDKGNLLAQKILEIDPSIPIAFESQNPICDSPIIGTLLDLLVLSEHPLHSSAEWGHIKASSTITTLLYPNTTLPSIPHIIAQDCCKNGLSDTLRVWSSLLLKAVPQEKKFDALRDRFESLISAATEFSLDANRSGSMLEFRSFVYGKEQRTTASPQEVKILTQHRSKGLGFDQVFVPFFLDRKGNNVFEPSIGYHEYQHFLQTNEWILENVPGPLQSTFPVFAKAAREQNDAMTFEDFCTFYVAVTRPKSELFIALPPKKETKTKAKAPKTWSFPLFLESTLGSADFSLGDSLWYTKATIKEENAPKTSPSSSANKQPSKTQQPTPAITRNTPSRHHHFRQKALDLFRLSERAAERGTSLHERLAQIEWLEPGVQPAGISPEEIDFRSDSALRRALTRPEGTVEVWRERSFEILRGHEWTSGTVDRVVVHGEGETRTLTIFDYKSDRQRPDESRDAFHTRLQDHYISQLEAYRAALSTLTGIPKARIRCALLLTSTLERLDLL